MLAPARSAFTNKEKITGRSKSRGRKISRGGKLSLRASLLADFFLALCASEYVHLRRVRFRRDLQCGGIITRVSIVFAVNKRSGR